MFRHISFLAFVVILGPALGIAPVPLVAAQDEIDATLATRSNTISLAFLENTDYRRQVMSRGYRIVTPQGERAVRRVRTVHPTLCAAAPETATLWIDVARGEFPTACYACVAPADGPLLTATLGTGDQVFLWKGLPPGNYAVSLAARAQLVIEDGEPVRQLQLLATQQVTADGGQRVDVRFGVQ